MRDWCVLWNTKCVVLYWFLCKIFEQRVCGVKRKKKKKKKEETWFGDSWIEQVGDILKFVFSPHIIISCVWLGSKHQLTNLTFLRGKIFVGAKGQVWGFQETGAFLDANVWRVLCCINKIRSVLCYIGFFVKYLNREVWIITNSLFKYSTKKPI